MPRRSIRMYFDIVFSIKLDILGVKKDVCQSLITFYYTFTDDIQIVVIHSRGVYNFMGINMVPELCFIVLL